MDAGIFEGMRLDTEFEKARFWGRHCQGYPITHRCNGTGGRCSEVFTAIYNECNGVSDLVYYKVNADNFEKGAGRGGDWVDDPKLGRMSESNLRFVVMADYDNCGRFGIDRGHQAPVASFNRDFGSASLTNMPSNLSPQSLTLNRNEWKYMEMDMRNKGEFIHGDKEAFIEVITGPLYELPPAMLGNQKALFLWTELFEMGIPAKVPHLPWCSNRTTFGFQSRAAVNANGRQSQVTCKVVDGSHLARASEDPNRLQLQFSAGADALPLRVPLGYFSLTVLKKGTGLGRRTCAYIMDQIGQCLIVSVELLSKLAHLNLTGTPYAQGGGTVVQPVKSSAEFNAFVNPFYCVPPGGTLRKRNSCLYVTANFTDPSQIKMKHLDVLWHFRENAKSMGRRASSKSLSRASSSKDFAGARAKAPRAVPKAKRAASVDAPPQGQATNAEVPAAVVSEQPPFPPLAQVRDRPASPLRRKQPVKAVPAAEVSALHAGVARRQQSSVRSKPAATVVASSAAHGDAGKQPVTAVPAVEVSALHAEAARRQQSPVRSQPAATVIASSAAHADAGKQPVKAVPAVEVSALHAGGARRVRSKPAASVVASSAAHADAGKQPVKAVPAVEVSALHAEVARGQQSPMRSKPVATVAASSAAHADGRKRPAPSSALPGEARKKPAAAAADPTASSDARKRLLAVQGEAAPAAQRSDVASTDAQLAKRRRPSEGSGAKESPSATQSRLRSLFRALKARVLG